MTEMRQSFLWRGSARHDACGWEYLLMPHHPGVQPPKRKKDCLYYSLLTIFILTAYYLTESEYLS